MEAGRPARGSLIHAGSERAGFQGWGASATPPELRAAVGGKQAPFEGQLGMAPQTLGVPGRAGAGRGVNAASPSTGKPKRRGCLGDAGLPTSCALQSSRSGWRWR